MRHRLILFLAAAALVACAKDEAPTGEDDAHDHADEAVHGGVIVEIAPPGGADVGHLEVKLDHDAGTVQVWASRHDDGEMKFDKPPVLNFTADGMPQSVTGQGSGTEWTFKHEGFKKEPTNARFMIVLGGKIYTPDWDHTH